MGRPNPGLGMLSWALNERVRPSNLVRLATSRQNAQGTGNLLIGVKLVQ